MFNNEWTWMTLWNEKNAMNDEIESYERNYTFAFALLPEDKKS